MSKYAGDGWKWMPNGQPRVCALCGGRITLKQSVWFKTCPPLLSWHMGCP